MNNRQIEALSHSDSVSNLLNSLTAEERARFLSSNSSLIVWAITHGNISMLAHILRYIPISTALDPNAIDLSAIASIPNITELNIFSLLNEPLFQENNIRQLVSLIEEEDENESEDVDASDLSKRFEALGLPVPDIFQCPILLDVINEPVKVACKSKEEWHYFDAANLQNANRQNLAQPRNPINRELLKSGEPMAVPGLKKKIEKYIEYAEFLQKSKNLSKAELQAAMDEYLNKQQQCVAMICEDISKHITGLSTWANFAISFFFSVSEADEFKALITLLKLRESDTADSLQNFIQKNPKLSISSQRFIQGLSNRVAEFNANDNVVVELRKSM